LEELEYRNWFDMTEDEDMKGRIWVIIGILGMTGILILVGGIAYFLNQISGKFYPNCECKSVTIQSVNGSNLLRPDHNWAKNNFHIPGLQLQLIGLRNSQPLRNRTASEADPLRMRPLEAPLEAKISGIIPGSRLIR